MSNYSPRSGGVDGPAAEGASLTRLGVVGAGFMGSGIADAAVLASNTSSIPIATLAGATARPERVCGMHFFSPVPVMKLVEVVVGLDTAPETIATVESLASRMGKTTIQTKDRSGFIVNML